MYAIEFNALHIPKTRNKPNCRPENAQSIFMNENHCI